MENIRFLKIALFVLLLLNLSLLAFLWFRHPPHPGGRGEGPAKLLIEKVGLDAEQQAEYARMREDHQRAMRDFRQRNDDLHQRLYHLLASNREDTLAVQQLTDSLALGQKKMEGITFDHFRALRAICRPDQQPRFDAFIGEALRNLPPAAAPPPPR